MSEETSARAEHCASLPPPAVPRTIFAAAMLKLTGYQATNGRDGKCDGRRAAMLKALDNRASWPALRSWLRGDRGVPQWALDLLLSKLDTYASMREHVRLGVKAGRGRNHMWRPPE